MTLIPELLQIKKIPNHDHDHENVVVVAKGPGDSGRRVQGSQKKEVDREPAFRILFSGDMDDSIPQKWKGWAQCARQLIRPGEQESIVDRFKVVQSPLGRSFLVFTVRGATGHATTNCHSHADAGLKMLRGTLEEGDAVLGIPVCGTNPQDEILNAATTVIANKLSDEPDTLKGQIKSLAVQPGDILVWRNVMGLPVHSSTLYQQDSSGNWLLDDKRDDQAPEIKDVADVAAALFMRKGRSDSDLFESESGYLYYHHVEVRRPK